MALARASSSSNSEPAMMRDVVTVAWVTLGGVNTGTDEVEALERLLQGTRVRVNLIDVNDTRTDGYRRAEDAERDDFRDRLRARGISTIRRYSGGASRHAACGMLANVRSTPIGVTAPGRA